MYLLQEMFSYNGELSASVVSSNTFTKYEKASQETVFHLEAGVPFYLFQWHLDCLGADWAYVDSYSNLFYQHTSPKPPPDPAHMTEQMKKKLIVL